MLIVSLFLAITNLYAQLPLVSNQNIDFSSAVSTISSGDWSNPAVWSSGSVPDANTDVIISNNDTIYIDIEGALSGQIVDLCRNLQIQPLAILQMGHNTPSFAKDLRINGSILCNGTFSAGRNQPSGSGDGSIYTYNSRIYMNLIEDTTYISGTGFFNPRSLSIASDFENKSLIIDLYNMQIDDNFAIKSDNRVDVEITHFAYIKIDGILGLTGSDYQFSSPTAKSDLTIDGLVVTNDVSLFTKNTTPGESTSLTITNQGSLYTQKINKGILDKKTEAAGFVFTVEIGGLFRLGQGINIDNLTTSNPHFVFTVNGELRKHYSETLPTKAQITASIDQFDPNNGADVSEIQDIFGATHIAGWYNFTDRPYLLEGLDFYKEFGASSVKTVLTSKNGNMFNAYHFNHTWPNFQDLKEVAQHEMIDSLFKRTHIKTHTFWTTTKLQGDFKNGPDFEHDMYLDEEQQFYDLTKYILQTYSTSNKTFVYQNWEGDWMLRGQGNLWENDPSLIPDDVFWMTEGLARLFRARQRGIERAKAEEPGSTAQVLLALEFNKLWTQQGGNYITMMDNGTPSVLEHVIPHSRLDLSSWSAYDGGWSNSDNPHGHAMWKGLEIARYFTTETGELNAGCPVQIGEFGINENPPYNGSNTETVIRNRYGRYIGVALGLDIPSFYLWNFYSSGQQGGPNGFSWEKDTQYEESFLYEWLDGKWLIEPDGSWGYAATFLMEQWANTLSDDEIINSNGDYFKLYPNPTSSFIELSNFNERASITIIDLNGNVLKKMGYVPSERIYVGDISSGVYLLKIDSDDTTKAIKKLIIN